jgi:dimethylhistidine N-methyltransferase
MLQRSANTQDAFLGEVLAGLQSSPRTLPSKYFYDATGSALFEQICDLPEYYLTRTELGIMRDRRAEIASALGPDALVVEFGSGAGTKTRLLLGALDAPRGYVPVEISATALDASVDALRRDLPGLSIEPVCADYTRPFDLPELARDAPRRVVYFPGSTIGNFARAAATDFLGLMRQIAGPSGGLLIGVDLKKDPALIHAAYNDSAGVTAAFNRNVLARLRDTLGADIAPHDFYHHAPYDPVEGRVEMHLIAKRDVSFTLAEQPITIAAGETILTEYSHKYTPAEFEALAAHAGFSLQTLWTDADAHFGLFHFT